MLLSYMCPIIIFHRLCGTESEMLGMMDALEFVHGSHTWVHHPQCTHVRSTSGTRCNQVAGASSEGAVGILRLACRPNELNHRPFATKISQHRLETFLQHKLEATI